MSKKLLQLCRDMGLEEVWANQNRTYDRDDFCHARLAVEPDANLDALASGCQYQVVEEIHPKDLFVVFIDDDEFYVRFMAFHAGSIALEAA